MEISEIIKQFESDLSVEDMFYLVGIVPLALWLLRTAFGTTALANSSPRRNNMPLYLPLVPLFIWFLGAPAAVGIMEISFPDMQGWQEVLATNIIICIAAIAAIIITLFLVRKYFVRRLKGFGLNPRTIPADLLAAVTNLISVYPPILLVLVATLYIGQTIWGTKFELPQHEELKFFIAYNRTCVRAAIIITAAAVAPAFEEFVFRGLFQTLIRSYLNRSWPAIFISAALFASAHVNATHWPALFTLGICMGYSYEKSGSLFRPIFIHALFNSAQLLAALYVT